MRLLAEGGMGAVLLVGQVPGVGRGPFALKLLRRDLLASPDSVARFRRELACHARLARALQVPRLVACLAAYDDPDPALSWALFPFFAEGTLEDRLARGLRASEALLLLADAVEGLQSLHGHGYVHRDVHPRNIFVEREGGRWRGLLGDLGVGLFRAGNTLVSQEEIDADSARRIGHSGYVDPLEPATPSADLYGAGATLARILTAREPPGRAPAKALDLAGVSGVLARDLEAKRQAEELLERLTSLDRGRRFESAREARVAIVELAERLQRAERRRGVVVSIGSSAGAIGQRGTSGRVKWGAAALVLLVAGVAAGALLARVPRAPGAGAPAPVALADPLPREADPAPVEGERAPIEARPAEVERAEESGARPVALAKESLAAPSKVNRPTAGPRPSSPPRDVVRDLESADRLLRGGQPAAAERGLRGVLLEAPAHPDAAARLALLLSAGGASGRAEAEKLLGRALEAHPERGDLRLTLGRLLLQRGEAARAAELLESTPAGSSHRAELAALAKSGARGRAGRGAGG